MAVTTFAAIDVGSYNITLEIFELSKKSGMHSVNRVRQSLELGRDTYADKRISREHLDELCHILTDYQQIMQEYQVSGFRACAKSALREASNQYLILEQVYQRTGIRIDVLSNSEQRFLGYKSVASREEDFHQIIQRPTAIVDLGGGSIQISLFNQDVLVSTTNIRVGSLRIREKLTEVEHQTTHYDRLVEELIQKEIRNFKRFFLRDGSTIENFILIGDYFTDLIFQNKSARSKMTTGESFSKWYNKIRRRSIFEVATEMGVPEEYASVIIPSAILYKCLIEDLGTKTIWLPGIQLTDGIAYDYGESHKMIRRNHDFENDIIMSAKNIAHRFGSNTEHTDMTWELACKVFDSVKKRSGLGTREKLLLHIAVLLHDCGSYISLANAAQCSYNIILSSEIIGLSERERHLIASIVKFNTEDFDFDKAMEEGLEKEDYLRVAKLTAILRVVNGMDRSHLQKVKSLRTSIKDSELVLTVETEANYVLEKGLFQSKADFFEEIYDIRPVIKVKKLL